jgi:hypothetical protein
MIRINRLLIIACSVGFLLGCTRNTELLDENRQWQVADIKKNARVKFVYAYASITPAITAGAGPNMAIFMDNQRLTGNTATLNFLSYAIVSGTSSFVFPSSANYALVPPGNHTFYFVMNRFTAGVFAPVSGDTVFKTTTNLEAAKKYSVFLVDTVQKPGVVVKEDIYVDPPPGKFKVRYANLVANPNEKVDVYSTRQGKVIFSNITYKQITNYDEYSVTELSDTLQIRLAGTTTVRETANGFSPTPQGVYTLMSRGKTGVTGRTPATAFFLTK